LSGPTTRVVLVDDEAMVRAGLRLLIASEDDLEVVGEAADGQQGVLVAERERPHVVLMDVRMPRMSGLEAAARIIAATPGTRVLMLTTFDEDEVVDTALRQGVAGFLLKSCTADELTAAVRSVAEGHALLAPQLTRRVIERFTRSGARTTAPRAEPTGLDELTERERDVLVRMARGLSNAEIAEDLVVGTATVKTHVSRVLTKLGLRDRVQAVVVAYQAGLVAPD